MNDPIPQKDKDTAAESTEMNRRHFQATNDLLNSFTGRHNKIRGKLRWQTILAISMCLVFVMIAIFAPILAVPDDPQDPSYYRQTSTGISRIPNAPNHEAVLGTVDRSYDIYYSLIWGTRQSVIFGLSTALVAAFLGTMVGTSSAYLGGRLDNITMRVTDAFLSFPIISAVALFSQLQSLLSPTLSSGLVGGGSGIVEYNLLQKLIINTNPIFLALILFTWMPYARIIHTQVLTVKKTQYIDAAHVVGVRNGRIIWKHIIPNVISPVIVLATRDIGRMVVIQATFTYIGLGGNSAWATILYLGSKWIIGPGGSLFNHWWVYLPITLMLVLFGISWNFLGDEMNLIMNPQMSKNKY
ncbi:MAG: ABC transporter permease [Chloroflexi bacterium]|nr:ABC transporter permease [Chloroflexota bacterium]